MQDSNAIAKNFGFQTCIAFFRNNSNEESDNFCDNFNTLNHGMSRAESDLADVITMDDRERIMETERTLMESSYFSIASGGESDGEEVKQEGEMLVQEKRRNRRRRRLPEIPKDKKREFGFRVLNLDSSVVIMLS